MRLELSIRSDLALRGLRILASSGERIKRESLASQLRTSPDFLARIMAVLVSRGWVGSRTGPSGGYELAESAKQISVFELIEAIEGVPPEDRCVLKKTGCDPARPCALHEAWSRARKALFEELEGSPVIQ
jgi:Rrf2 family iron-sulfur cluster assembly transcriptional regulator